MRPYSSVRPSEAPVIPFLVHLGIVASQGKSQVIGMDTQQFIHSVKLHILHKMKPYSRENTI